MKKQFPKVPLKVPVTGEQAFEGPMALIGSAVLVTVLIALCWTPTVETIRLCFRGDRAPHLSSDLQIDGVPAQWAYDEWFDPHKDSFVLGGIPFLKQVYTTYGKPCLNHLSDGSPLRIGDRVFPKGIGTLAPAKIAFALKGNYDRFSCQVGLDRDCGINYGATFSIVADGREIFRSPVLHGDSPPFPVDCSVGKVQDLLLVVENGQIGDANTYVDLIDPHLTPAGPGPR